MSLSTDEETVSPNHNIPLSAHLREIVSTSLTQDPPPLRHRGLSRDATRLADHLLYALMIDYTIPHSPRQLFCHMTSIGFGLKMQHAVASARGVRFPGTGYDTYHLAPILWRLHTTATELGIPIYAVEESLLEGYAADMMKSCNGTTRLSSYARENGLAKLRNRLYTDIFVIMPRVARDRRQAQWLARQAMLFGLRKLVGKVSGWVEIREDSVRLLVAYERGAERLDLRGGLSLWERIWMEMRGWKGSTGRVPGTSDEERGKKSSEREQNGA